MKKKQPSSMLLERCSTLFNLMFVILVSSHLLNYLQAEVGEYHKLQLDIGQHEKKLMSEIIRPERVLCFLDTGRLVSFINIDS